MTFIVFIWLYPFLVWIELNSSLRSRFEHWLDRIKPRATKRTMNNNWIYFFAKSKESVWTFASFAHSHCTCDHDMHSFRVYIVLYHGILNRIKPKMPHVERFIIDLLNITCYSPIQWCRISFRCTIALYAVANDLLSVLF